MEVLNNGQIQIKCVLFCSFKKVLNVLQRGADYVSVSTSKKNIKEHLWDCDGVKVQRANFDLLEEEVELRAPRRRRTTEGQRVAV